MTNDEIAALATKVLQERGHRWGDHIPNRDEVQKMIESLTVSNLEDTYDPDGITVSSGGGILVERYWIDEDKTYNDVYVYVGRYEL